MQTKTCKTFLRYERNEQQIWRKMNYFYKTFYILASEKRENIILQTAVLEIP